MKKTLIGKMPELREIPLKVVLEDGTEHLTSEYDSVRWTLGHWSLKVWLVLKKGEVEVRAPINNLREVLMEATRLTKAVLPMSP